MLAPLRRREDEAAILDGARAHQHMPMGAAGRHREGRRDRQEIGAGLRQGAIELREAQVVAHGHAEHAPGQCGEHRRLAGTERVRFAVALAAGELDIEHVDLVVALRDRAVGGDEEGSVGEPLVAILAAHHRRSQQQPGAGLARELAEGGEHRVIGFVSRFFDSQRPLRLHHVAHFGRHDQRGACIARAADEVAGGGDVRLGLARRGELDAGGGEGGAHAREIPSLASSLPARSRA